MIIFFLTSGLFLGWSLGANDASNVFGSAVGSRMITFWKAAIIASLFVILGSVMQGEGTSQTLGKLGSVNALGGSFTVALAAAVSVYLMTKYAIPVSSTQAIVGAIIGWNIFTGNSTDKTTLVQIVSTWVTGPVLGGIFAVFLFIVLTYFKKRTHIHIIRFESFIKTGLIVVGAFGAYSLGANNIANVMGVFVPAFNLQDLNLGILTLSSSQQLFLLGGLAIAAGIISYSNRVMESVGNNIVELSPDAALVVVLSQAMVLFIFSSSGLSLFFDKIGLFKIPLVPVSSTQVVIGSIIGIGLYRGVRNLNFRIIGEIGIGWVATPILSGLLSFFSLFFVKNIFGIDVGNKIGSVPVPDVNERAITLSNSRISEILQYFILGLLVAGILSLVLYLIIDRKRKIEFNKSEEKFWKNLK